MSIIFDPADRGASQNAAQGNVAQGGAAPYATPWN